MSSTDRRFATPCDAPTASCALARALEVIGDRWTVLILREAFAGVERFEEFHVRLGVARNILSERLRTLVGHGLLERQRYCDHPCRYVYRLTARGRDFETVLGSLRAWSDRNFAGPLPPPLQESPLAAAPALTVALGAGQSQTALP